MSLGLPVPESFFSRSQTSANAAGNVLGAMSNYETNLANNALRQEEMAQRLELENRRMDMDLQIHNDKLDAARPTTGNRIMGGLVGGGTGYGLGSAVGGAMGSSSPWFAIGGAVLGAAGGSGVLDSIGL